jgi:tRNA(Ile)-lysidine synthase TilS/MesJ
VYVYACVSVFLYLIHLSTHIHGCCLYCIVAAVSGGPDSMAMLYLLETWCAESARDLTVVSIDHCLRETSADDQNLVRKYCEERGRSTLCE